MTLMSMQGTFYIEFD